MQLLHQQLQIINIKLTLNKKTMSKDKGSKAHKKAPSLNSKKDQSDYQASKNTSSKEGLISINKKHN
jgi:hypothetical protein